MRVLMLSQMYPRQDAPLYGEFIHRQARALAAAGAEVTVIAPVMHAPCFTWWRARWNLLRHLPVHGWRDGVRIYRPRYWSPPGLKYYFVEGHTMRAGIRSLCDRLHNERPFHVIHGNRLFPEGFAALALGRRWGVPVLAMARGMDLNRLPQWGAVYRAALRRVAAEAATVLSVSQGLLQDLRTFAPAPSRSRVIYNGCATPAARMSKSLLRKRHGLPATGVLALYVGRLEEAKGTVELIRAMGVVARRNPSLHLVAVGKIHARDCVEDVKRSGWNDRFHVMGEQNHAAVGEIMRACDLFVFPSWREGVPNAVLEAMGNGLPVVATRAGGIAEVVPPAAGVLVGVRDIRGLMAGVSRLAADGALRRRMGRAGANHVSAHFSWPANAAALLQAYEEAIERKGGRPC